LRDIAYSFDIVDYEDSIENYVTRVSEVIGDELLVEDHSFIRICINK
jgi:hypothetical protein